MRTACLKGIVFFFFLISFFFLATPSHACTINASPNVFSPDYKGNVTITSPDCNFQTAVKYTVFARPQNITSGGLFANYAVDRKNPQNSQNIIANLNLFQGAIGKSNPGTWTLEVCSATILSDCANKDNIVSKTSITVNAVPTVTPTQTPANLPRIDPLAQSKCTFQIGETVTLIVTNIQPETNYSRWWESDGFFASHKPVGKSDLSGSNLIVTVPNNENTKAEKRQLCIDVEGSGRTGENCIPLTFTTNVPTDNTSCDPTSNTSLLTSGQGTVPPPCSKYDGEKCISVSTAIGEISTEPQGFVKSIYSIVLGLAGGIALVLIILAGYRYLTSAGNPEAVKAANEQLVSAIVGLMFIILSFVILQVIGVDILQIPGFTN